MKKCKKYLQRIKLIKNLTLFLKISNQILIVQIYLNFLTIILQDKILNSIPKIKMTGIIIPII